MPQYIRLNKNLWIHRQQQILVQVNIMHQILIKQVGVSKRILGTKGQSVACKHAPILYKMHINIIRNIISCMMINFDIIKQNVMSSA